MGSVKYDSNLYKGICFSLTNSHISSSWKSSIIWVFLSLRSFRHSSTERTVKFVCLTWKICSVFSVSLSTSVWTEIDRVDLIFSSVVNCIESSLLYLKNLDII